MNIIKKLKSIEKLYHESGCSDGQIINAEKELGVKFPKEYKDVLKEFGSVSFYGTEWTGFSTDDYLDVVKVTKSERERNEKFPKDCFVLENLAIDGIIIVCNAKGQVFSLHYEKQAKIHDSISSYLDECIDRKKA